jgi:LacI family transcriptional regulator, repressor for deo operon, udp, cdd, tsx, nupC, and nupG
MPRDFSVTGFDDVPQAGFMSPPLTTIRQPRTAIGKQAMALLLNMLSGAKAPEEEILLMPDLVIRNSVAPPRKTQPLPTRVPAGSD